MPDLQRDMTVDVLRGLAIFTMAAANMAAEVLAPPHPFGFRLYGSFAAPFFITISSMMVVWTTRMRGYSLRRFLTRGALTVSVGALIDLLVFRIYPFMTIDVLYLIGLSLPLSFLFSRLSPTLRWAIVLSIFLLTPILQHLLGYVEILDEISLSTGKFPTGTDVFRALYQWIIGGWFPIFPWLGFSFLGVNFGFLRWERERGKIFGGRFLGIGLVLLFGGAVLWGLHPGKLLVREGCSELFYPPTLGYMAVAVGIFLVLAHGVDRNPSLPALKLFEIFGRCALFLYILHLVLIEFAIVPFWHERPLPEFIFIYAFLVLLLLGAAVAVRALTARWRDPPFLVRFFLGG